MALGTRYELLEELSKRWEGRPDRCLKYPVSCSLDSEQTVTSAEEPGALSEHTDPVPLSWDVCPWIHTKSSSSPDLRRHLGHPCQLQLFQVFYLLFFEGYLHILELLLPLVSFSSYCPVFLQLGTQLPLILFLLLQRLNRLRGLDFYLIHPHSLQWRSSRWRICRL